MIDLCRVRLGFGFLIYQENSFARALVSFVDPSAQKLTDQQTDQVDVNPDLTMVTFLNSFFSPKIKKPR
ncbi:hypothetical protein RI570_20095 [Brucella pseudogrignonensis]|uniref:hypothetical protein n=1 Tax=Brucella pseudogrignonensis TaxID=419475 RepID=UPI0028B5C0E4|nr:hypothetical protein [Brucella pseudogrignonensis]MDT6942370.1 hypothetical protein [Brucella pseudogrignonensis]